MFGRRVLAIAFLQGASVLAVVFAVYLWSILTDHPDDVVRSLSFATLVVGNIALILVNRSWRLSIWRSLVERKNRTLAWIVAAAGLLLVLLLAVPTLRRAFHFGAITWAEALVVLVAGFAGVTWFELYKIALREPGPSKMSVMPTGGQRV